MFKKICFSFLFLLFFECHSNFDYNIVFIHLGNQLPTYINDALIQVRTFNINAPIFLILNKSADTKSLSTSLNITLIYCEDLEKSSEHHRFANESLLDSNSYEGFWRKTTERFFYLDELINKYNLVNVFHLENDNMLYVNLESQSHIFKKYKNIAAIFDNDNRCIPGFIYFANKFSSRKLVAFIANNSRAGMNDMQIIAQYKQRHGLDEIDHLPILIDSYVDKNRLINKLGQEAANQNLYCSHFQEFHSIFDGAAIGQYLGGISPRNGNAIAGFINESCIFNPSHFSYEWIKDEKGRKVPHIIYENKRYRINNLHIHCKKLEEFKS